MIWSAALFLSLLFAPFFAYSREWRPFGLRLEKVSARFAAPELCDIDIDGDLDLFAGTGEGFLLFYENTGAPGKPLFQLKNKGVSRESSFFKISVFDKAIPRFIDIDNDNDPDLFIGNNSGNIAFYRNEGDVTRPDYVGINSGRDATNSFFNINIGLSAAPFFADIDHDGDYDLFIGNAMGYIAFYKNEGTAASPVFRAVDRGTSRPESFCDIDAGEYAVPYFADLDGDGEPELFIGNYDGLIYVYKNAGTAKKPDFRLIDKKFASVNTAGDAALCFGDIDNDGLDELLIGNSRGEITALQNPESVKISEPDQGGSLAKAGDKKGEKGKSPPDTGDQTELMVKKAEELLGEKDPVEAKSMLMKTGGSAKAVRDLMELCDRDIRKVMEKAGGDSLLFREVGNSFKKGIEEYISGKFESSASQLRKVLAVIPGHELSSRYLRRAEKKLLAEKQKKEAMDHYKKAVKEHEKKRTESAFEQIREAVRLDPENFEYYGLYTRYSNEMTALANEEFYRQSLPAAEELVRQKKYDEALVLVEQLQNRFPLDERADQLMKECARGSAELKSRNRQQMKIKFLALAEDAQKRFDLKKALEYYRAAKNCDPLDKQLDEKIAAVREDLDKRERGTLSPELVNQYFKEGLKYYSMGLYEEAIREWEKVLRINPGNVMAQKNIKKARELLGK